MDREKWHSFKFKAGLLLEGAIRDDEQKAQGTMIVEVLESISTDAHGHWFRAKYVTASDPHMRWWMKEGAGALLAARCAYHACEGPSIDCTVTRRGASIHMGRFRVLALKGRGLEPRTKKAGEELPWVDPGEEENEEDEADGSEAESSGGKGLKAKLLKARDEVERLEKELKEKLLGKNVKTISSGHQEEKEEA